MDQIIALLALSIVILLAGLGLYLAKIKKGFILVLVGGLWLLALLIYGVYSYFGFYAPVGLKGESAGPLTTTVIGFTLLIIGIVVAVWVAKKGGKK